MTPTVATASRNCWACGARLNSKGERPCCDRTALTLDKRLASLRPGLPCCESGTGACTGGSHCWADEPDNIREDYQ